MENWIYVALTAIILTGGRVQGAPWDPDRSWTTSPDCNIGPMCRNDKREHFLAGTVLIGFSMSLDRSMERKGGCWGQVLRGTLRTSVIASGYEVWTAYADPHWARPQPGYGIGARDIAATVAGAAAMGSAVCLIESAFKKRN